MSQIVEYQVIVYLDSSHESPLEVREHIDDLAFNLGGGCLLSSSSKYRFLFILPSLKAAASLRFKIRTEYKGWVGIELRGAYKKYKKK